MLGGDRANEALEIFFDPFHARVGRGDGGPDQLHEAAQRVRLHVLSFYETSLGLRDTGEGRLDALKSFFRSHLELQPVYSFAAQRKAGPGPSAADFFHIGVRDFVCLTHNSLVRHYERRLPHWDSVGQAVFVTFRLAGSLPRSRVFPPEQISAGERFAEVDRLLDNARTGPFYLRQPEIAGIVMDAILHGDHKMHRYELHAFVVMPNHVHLLVTSHVANAKWLGPLKGYTGQLANRALKRSGPLWQEESYDHLVRNGDEFDRIQRYIENNPVRAGLVAQPEDWRWSSAARIHTR
jgi:REP element-mobilizing transposase RayT